MHIAEQKYRENIAEYLLYMWQIEDIIRAFDFDIEKIENNLIRHNYEDEELIVQVRNWYDSLVRKMVREKLQKSGHLTELGEIEIALTGLYTKLLLKLKGVDITKETEDAFDTFRKLVSYLTKQFHKMKRGELNFQYN